MANHATEQALSVKVSSPSKVYMDVSAQSVTAVNDTGEFDILPGHHNFISLLNPGTLRVVASNVVKEMTIEGGIIHIRNDSVDIFLDI